MLVSGVDAIHEHLCLEDDYTNDLPIFIEKRTICNFEAVPVLVYPVKITPDYATKLCLKGRCRSWSRTKGANRPNLVCPKLTFKPPRL